MPEYTNVTDVFWMLICSSAPMSPMCSEMFESIWLHLNFLIWLGLIEYFSSVAFSSQVIPVSEVPISAEGCFLIHRHICGSIVWPFATLLARWLIVMNCKSAGSPYFSIGFVIFDMLLKWKRCNETEVQTLFRNILVRQICLSAIFTVTVLNTFFFFYNKI